MIERIELAPDIFLNCTQEQQTQKFCRQRVSVNFVWPATRERATAEALLSLVLERGYAGCPDMTELSKRLARLYGAGLSVDTAVNGANRVLTVAVSGIKTRFALHGEDLGREYCEIAFGVAFDPVMKQGVLDSEFIEIEREQLREELESEMNEKRLYCLKQARRKFFGDAPAGVERRGYADELSQLTAQQVTQAFWHMVHTARIEIMCMGMPSQLVAQAVKPWLDRIAANRAPVLLNPMQAMPRVPAARFTEPMDTVQGKLCMLFTGGEIVSGEQLSVMRVAVALLGGTATSRLFRNVREKQSLCYYCSAGYTASTGMLCIDSGVEHKNAVRAEQAIMHELQQLCRQPAAEQELAETKRALKNALLNVGDSLGAMEGWVFGELMRKSTDTPEQVVQQIERVTAQQVQQVLSSFTLSVTYCITKAGEQL